MHAFVQRAWDKALGLLNPSEAHLRHGLGLHRDSLVFVFSLNSPLGASARQADPLQVLAGLDTAHHLGVKFMHLTYNRRNAIGDGCAEPEDAGLTDLGRRVIEQMNRLQIVVDVSHAGLRTGLEAAASSTRPIAATHTAAGALSPHIRAKSDQVIRAIADSGGLIGVCVIPPFLGRTGDIRAMLDHVDYIAKLVGVAHVAIGTDIGYHPPPPADVEERIAQRRASDAAPSTQWPADDPILQAGAFDECHHGSLAWTNWPLFTVGLVQRGYADVDVRGIIGGNALRLIRTSGGTE